MRLPGWVAASIQETWYFGVNCICGNKSTTITVAPQETENFALNGKGNKRTANPNRVRYLAPVVTVIVHCVYNCFMNSTFGRAAQGKR